MAIDLTLIIFSKNRPLQLDFLLSSLKTYCSDLDTIKISVLYKVTTNRFAQAYNTLINRHSSIQFHQETNFYKQLCSLLGSSFTAFMVDDNVCFRPFSFAACVEQLQKIPNTIGYSLRLGQDFVGFRKEDEKLGESPGVVHWPSKSGDYWNYPMEVSSSIYSTKLIREMVTNDPQAFITGPNRLEVFLWSKRSIALPFLLYAEKSICICIPLNNVQDGGANLVFTGPGYDIDSLLSRFEKDEPLRLPIIPSIHIGHFIPSVNEMKDTTM